MGDFALPCFKFAKIFRKSPALIAEEIARSVPADEFVSEVSAVNGYVNFKIDRDFWGEGNAFARPFRKGALRLFRRGNGKTVCIDYSSVNIAKPFHIGHLSTTVLGSSLYKLHKFLGYTPVGINHLGDYGTQFGKLISAFKRWGSREDVEKAACARSTNCTSAFIGKRNRTRG